MKTNKTLVIFLLCHFLIWSLLPILLRANLPMDSAEALIWGMVGEWGTNKHPPLSGWLADWAWLLSGKNPAALYVLSQILVCGGLFYIYKLAKCFLSAEKALIAVIFMEGVAYYSMVTPEYNCNIVALLLWPACAYHFYQGLQKNRFADWLCFGIFAGLNIITKYVSGALLFSLGLYLVLTSSGRKTLASWKIYFSALVAFAIITPHLVWLYNRDFFVIDYFLGRASGQALPYGLGHIFYPAKFFIAQIMTSAATLIAFFIARYYGNQQSLTISRQNREFIFFAGIMPLLLMALVPFATGVKLKTMWGSPALYMLTIILFVWLPFATENMKKHLLATAYGFMGLFAIAFALQCVCTLSPKFNLNAKEFVAQVGGNNTHYVGGNVWLASTVGAYGQDNPQVIFEMKPQNNPWIDMQDAIAKGVLLVEEDLNVYNAHRADFPMLEEAEVYILKARNVFGKQKEYPIYYGKLSGEK